LNKKKIKKIPIENPLLSLSSKIYIKKNLKVKLIFSFFQENRRLFKQRQKSKNIKYYFAWYKETPKRTENPNTITDKKIER